VPGKYLVILKDINVARGDRLSILKAAGVGKAYRTIPVIEVECDDNTAESLRVFPAVRTILPALDGIDETRLIANGVDFLATLGELQRNGDFSEAVSRTYTGGRTRGEMPGYPRLQATARGIELLPDPQIDWPAEPAIMPVINMSLGTFPRDYPFLPNDLVNLATWGAAHQQLVVIPAGNCGHHFDVETMSAWAQAPWVLSVGATTDETGTELAEYSSRGSSNNPASGPDLVACGVCSTDRGKSGTSFAAPKVTVIAMICAAAILQLRHAVQVATSQDVDGVRLVGAGWLDAWGEEIHKEYMSRWALPALPVVGPDSERISATMKAASVENVRLDIRGNERILREMLVKAARPVPGYGPHEVGAGFLDEDIALDYLASLSGASLIRMFGDGHGSTSLFDKTSDIKVLDRTELQTLAELVRLSSPIWKFDWRTQRWALRRASADELSDLSEDERRYGIGISWPPDQLSKTA
jgi:hypothetical protein